MVQKEYGNEDDSLSEVNEIEGDSEIEKEEDEINKEIRAWENKEYFVIDLVCHPLKPSDKRYKLTIDLQEEEIKRKLEKKLAAQMKAAEEKRIEEEKLAARMAKMK